MARALHLAGMILPATLGGCAVVLSGCQTISAIPKGRRAVLGLVCACWGSVRTALARPRFRRRKRGHPPERRQAGNPA
jgi:hypothetical protein